MRRISLSALLIVTGLAGAARAEPESVKAPLVLVVESSDGVASANQLRATLSKQFGLKVLALGDVDLEGEQPGALMAIATERSNAVRVVYVDAHGGRDTLRAPAPPRHEDMNSVVQALAGALLQRHLQDFMQPRGVEIKSTEPPFWLDEASRMSLSAFSRSLHAALSRIGYPRHRSGDLHRDDF